MIMLPALVGWHSEFHFWSSAHPALGCYYFLPLQNKVPSCHFSLPPARCHCYLHHRHTPPSLEFRHPNQTTSTTHQKTPIQSYGWHLEYNGWRQRQKYRRKGQWRKGFGLEEPEISQRESRLAGWFCLSCASPFACRCGPVSAIIDSYQSQIYRS